jgi:ankyrin repeat protein
MAAAGASEDSNEAADGRNVEMNNMADKKPSLPIESDLMQLARLGEIAAIQKLFDGGKFDATYTDEQGITPLHVSATLPSCHQL